MSGKRMTEEELDKYTLPMVMKKTIQRSCKGPISITKVDPRGDFILLENTCVNKPIVLTNWTLRRRGVDVQQNSFTFDKHYVLRPGRIVKIYAKDKGNNNPPHELTSETITSWGCGTYVFTQLFNHLNQEKASLIEKMEHYERELSAKPRKTINEQANEFDSLNLSNFTNNLNGSNFTNFSKLRQQNASDEQLYEDGYKLLDKKYHFQYESKVSN